jgi:hypothetical protein
VEAVVAVVVVMVVHCTAVVAFDSRSCQVVDTQVVHIAAAAVVPVANTNSC